MPDTDRKRFADAEQTCPKYDYQNAGDAGGSQVPVAVTNGDLASCVGQVLQICIPKSRLIVVEAVGTVNRTFYPVQGAVGKLVL